MWSLKVQVFRSSSKTWVKKCYSKLSGNKTQCSFSCLGALFLLYFLHNNIRACRTVLTGQTYAMEWRAQNTTNIPGKERGWLKKHTEVFPLPATITLSWEAPMNVFMAQQWKLMSIYLRGQYTNACALKNH